jgi:uncharacterized protein (TIGR02266 family)
MENFKSYAMKVEKNIEELFDTDLPTEEEKKSGLEKIPLPSSRPDRDGIERRQFGRADVSEHKLELKFANEVQFARQYIENISLGGLFVKTEQRPPMGTLMAIEFSIPSRGSHRIFSLTAKVCRVTPQGVGLEFTNLSQENRLDLEEFVRSALPQGTPLVTKPKASSIENLDRLRADRIVSSKNRKEFFKKLSLMGALLGLNAYLALETVENELRIHSTKYDAIRIQGQEIPVQNIRSIEKLKNNQWVIRTSGNKSVQITYKDLEQAKLPAHLSHTIQILQTTPPRTEIRKSKNTRGLTDTRR